MDNTCVCCGTIIPEGRQVCPICENNGNTDMKKMMVEGHNLRKEPIRFSKDTRSIMGWARIRNIF